MRGLERRSQGEVMSVEGTAALSWPAPVIDSRCDLLGSARFQAEGQQEAVEVLYRKGVYVQFAGLRKQFHPCRSAGKGILDDGRAFRDDPLIGMGNGPKDLDHRPLHGPDRQVIAAQA